MRYRSTPFILILACRDPWNQLSNLPLPKDFVLLSGLRGLKRKTGDYEALFIAENSFWISMNPDNLEFHIEHPLSRDIKGLLAPKLHGIVKKDMVVLERDPYLLFPLYYTRADDCFIFSPSRCLLSHIGEPVAIGDYDHIIADFASMKLNRTNPNKRVSYSSEENLENIKQILSEYHVYTYKTKGKISKLFGIKTIKRDELGSLDPLKSILLFDVCLEAQNISEILREYYEAFEEVWPFLLVMPQKC